MANALPGKRLPWTPRQAFSCREEGFRADRIRVRLSVVKWRAPIGVSRTHPRWGGSGPRLPGSSTLPDLGSRTLITQWDLLTAEYSRHRAADTQYR
jgi:hypothetical protein